MYPQWNVRNGKISLSRIDRSIPMDLAYLATIINGFLGIILLAFTYMYIDKLEKIGCACAEHPSRNFIKKYALFAIVFLLVIMFFPPAMLNQLLGPLAGTIGLVVNVIFALATIVFFILAIRYVRYLMREKCRCSEDLRRDILYIWSILEIVIIGSLVVLQVFIAVTSGALALVKHTVSDVSSSSAAIRNAVINPLGSLKKVPGSLKKTLKDLKKK